MDSEEFIAKGCYSAGISAGYNSYSAGNSTNAYKILGLLGLEGKLKTMSVGAEASYFFAKNTSVGLRFGFGDTNLSLDDASLDLDDSDLNMENQNYQGRKYATTAFIKNYFPMFGSRVFAMFNEIRVNYSFSQSKNYELTDYGKDGSFNETHNVSLSLNPGLAMFITDFVATEVSVELLNIGYSHTNQTENQVYKSEFNHFGTNYKLNPLALNFGIVFFFGGNSK